MWPNRISYDFRVIFNISSASLMNSLAMAIFGLFNFFNDQVSIHTDKKNTNLSRDFTKCIRL